MGDRPTLIISPRGGDAADGGGGEGQGAGGGPGDAAGGRRKRSSDELDGEALLAAAVRNDAGAVRELVAVVRTSVGSLSKIFERKGACASCLLFVGIGLSR